MKHACRSLLKQGNPEVLALFGYHDVCVNIQDFKIVTPTIQIGESLLFSFAITAKEQTKLRLEYGVDYVKANGKRKRKTFKISELLVKEHEQKNYTKKTFFCGCKCTKTLSWRTCNCFDCKWD